MKILHIIMVGIAEVGIVSSFIFGNLGWLSTGVCTAIILFIAGEMK